MKKKYTKPAVVFEDFTLSTNIATCEVTDPHDSRLFFEGMGFVFGQNCEFPLVNPGGDGEHNGICYHVMTTNYNLFNS